MKLEVHRFEAADGMTNDTHTINRSLHRQSTAFERLDDIRSVYDLTHINATKSTDGAAAEEAATSIKLAEALEIARQNFYKGKVSMVCLADEASGGDGGYVDKPVGGDTTTTTTITTATSASPPAPAPAAAKTRDVDALVQQLDEHIEQCVTFTTGTALLNESGAVTSCCSEQQLHAAVEQATRLLANVPRNAIDELLLLPPHFIRYVTLVMIMFGIMLALYELIVIVRRKKSLTIIPVRSNVPFERSPYPKRVNRRRPQRYGDNYYD